MVEDAEPEDIPFVIQPEAVEDVLLKSRIQGNLHVRFCEGAQVVTSGLFPMKEVCCGLYLTFTRDFCVRLEERNRAVEAFADSKIAI